MSEHKLTPPADNEEGSITRFHTEVAIQVNRISDSNDTLWTYVRKHEKFRDQAMTIGAVVVFVMGGIQVMSGLYIKDAISTQLEPVVTKLAKLDVDARIKVEADKQLQGIPDQMNSLRAAVTRLNDRIDILELRKR